MISVCIATHNGEKYIKNQLESILCQIGKYDEVVISDDGSTDKTLAIIGGFGDVRIKVHLFTQPNMATHTHEYVCRNFENALKHAKGDYIFLSDQDDEWMPNKVDVCLKDLQKYDLVLHEFSHIDENGNVTDRLHYNGTFRRRNYLLMRGKHFGCAMAFRKCVLAYALPFPKHLLLHDYWIGILTESLGRFYYEEEPLLRYRIHTENTSGNHNTLWFKLYYRIMTLILVVYRLLSYKCGIHKYKS